MLSILLFPITALLSRRYAAVPTPIATRAQE